MSLMHNMLLVCRVLTSQTSSTRGTTKSQGRFSPRLCCARRRLHGGNIFRSHHRRRRPRQQSRSRVSNNKVGVKTFYASDFLKHIQQGDGERPLQKSVDYEEWSRVRIFLEASTRPLELYGHRVNLVQPVQSCSAWKTRRAFPGSLRRR